MPDQSQYADVVGNMNNNQSNTTNNTTYVNSSQAEIEYLKSIDKTLKDLLKACQNTSQASARDSIPNRRDAQRASNMFSGKSRSKYAKSTGNAIDDFLDNFEKGLLDGLVGSSFRDTVSAALNTFAKDLGVSVEDIPKEFGKQLGNMAQNAFKGTRFGQSVMGTVNRAQTSFTDRIKNAYTTGRDNYYKRTGTTRPTGPNTSDPIKDAVNFAASAASNVEKPDVGGSESYLQSINTNVAAILAHLTGSSQSDVVYKATEAISAVTSQNDIGQVVDVMQDTMQMSQAANAASSAMGAIMGIGNIIANANPVMLAITAALIVLQPVIETLVGLFQAFAKAGNRVEESRKRNQELAQKRLEADVKSMIEAPFQILKDAAQEIYDVWDNQLRTINATQGYSKADLQELMSVYADRLREEDLTSVVSGADITENLAKVLESGLSGTVAEEFAYIATKLNAAIPTQDFFNYAETYASLAATAITQGKSEAEAISYANEQLELFASNVLYASRQLSGGFSTGLQNAQELFTEAVQISQASRTGNPSKIAGVLTAVAAITGAIAPDLASSMTDAIASAATGGNSNELVALRSLAGINASNTEFLRALADDPQTVFATLFSNLAEMQSMSEDAYMEVAEALSGVFGISMDAFARIDFNYLAQAISNMNVNNSALMENMELLASGETTTNKEALRMQQINEYMLEEGLSYVLDNEVARSIQEHMWDEQLARQIMEASYAVDLTGESMSLLTQLVSKFVDLVNLLNPFAWGRKIANAIQTSNEASAQRASINQLLEAGKVGNGNAESYYQLIARNQDFDLIPSYIQLLGGYDPYATASTITKAMNSAYSIGPSNFLKDTTMNLLEYAVQQNATDATGITSRYNWGSLSKTAANVIASGSGGALLGLPQSASDSQSTISLTETAQAALDSRLEKMIDSEYISTMVDEGKTFEDWVDETKRKGITDVESALSEAGYNLEDVQRQFEAEEVAAGGRQQLERQLKEEAFWSRQNEYANNMEDYTLQLIDLSTLGTELLTDILNKHTQFYDAWVDYFVNHTAYNKAYDYSDVERIRKEEQDSSDTAIYALAEALSKNTVDLRDPAIQTNALLAQILLIVQAIMQQNNKAGGFTLPDTLNALALGITFPTE